MSPSGAHGCQERRLVRHLAGALRFVSKPALALALTSALAAGCSSSPPPDDAAPKTYVERRPNVVVQHVNERRDPETGKMTTDEPEAKPVETRRLNLGKTDVEENAEDLRPSAVARQVEIVTWTDERIRGVLVSETRDGYTVDVTPPDWTPTAGRKLRTIPRAAVQTFRPARSD